VPTAISPSSRRYAAAAFQVAREAGDFDSWLNTLDRATEILQTPRGKQVFSSPLVSATDKRRALDEMLPNTARLAANFVHILADRNRLGQLPQVAAAFKEMVNSDRGLVTVDVTTAVPLDAATEKLVAERLGKYLNHDAQKLVIRSQVDPEIIGGVVAQVGDTRIDDSVRGRLDRLRRVLANA
jgi:F-type H+-transporting ATPase subunit delta